MAAIPAIGAARFDGGAEAEDFVVGDDRILEPDRLEVGAAGEGIGHGAGRAIGARERKVGIGAQVGAGDGHAVGLDVGAVAEIGELEHHAPRQALLHGELARGEGLVTHAAGAGEIILIGRDGGREERLDAEAARALKLAAQVVDHAVVLGKREAVVRIAEASGAGRHDGAVDDRAATVLPRGDLVGGVPADGEAVVHVALFERGVDGRVLVRLVGGGDSPTRLIAEIPVPPALVVLVEAEQAHGEFLRDEHAIVVGLVALLVPRAEH